MVTSVYAASAASRSPDAVIQQAENNALKNLENQLPREKSNDALPANAKADTNQMNTTQQTAKSNLSPSAVNAPAAPQTITPQQNPWVKPNSWAEQAKQNPWANQPLPSAPNTATMNQPSGTSALPPPPNIFAVPSFTPTPLPNSTPTTGAPSPANSTPNTKK